MLREAVRLEDVTLYGIADAVGRHRRRRGVSRISRTIARYAGLPIEHARSGAEIRAMEILRAAGRPLPQLNVRINGAEADLSWPRERLIIEIDGAPFHQDKGEDARKDRAWSSAGWSVRRLPADAVYEEPDRLLQRSPR
jgi:hypothetical protein